MTAQVDLLQVSAFLKSIIEDNVNNKEVDWINQQENKFQENFQLNSFYFTFSSASRFITKNPLNLSENQKIEADRVRKGFQPQYWNLLQCVRTYLLLMFPYQEAEKFEINLTRLHETADIDEQVTLYGALPLLPYPEEMSKRAAEGIRTNITDVFDAIALNNPYPADYLDQAVWNQMVLKAVFMQRPLYRIYGANVRSNEDLAVMLIDFSHERWAANREVTPELWQFVGPFLNSSSLADIEKIIHGDDLEKQAGLLACSQSNLPEAQQLLDQFPEIKEDIKNDKLNWTLIGKKYTE